jgi:lysophospholipase
MFLQWALSSILCRAACPSLHRKAHTSVGPPASPEPRDASSLRVHRLSSLGIRAEPDAPDTRPSIRSGGTMSQQEKDWVQLRRNLTAPIIRDLVARLDIPGFNTTHYFAGVDGSSSALPNIGIALSGGGYRAMLTGAGALAAWDSRSAGSEDEGNLGGLLQSATYISALSGGGWLVGSLYANNFTSVQDSVASPVVWQFDASILEGKTIIKLPPPCA